MKAIYEPINLNIYIYEESARWDPSTAYGIGLGYINSYNEYIWKVESNYNVF